MEDCFLLKFFFLLLLRTLKADKVLYLDFNVSYRFISPTEIFCFMQSIVLESFCL